MRKLLIALLILLIPASSHAIDKKIGATNQFKYGVFDISSKANGGAGLTYNTHYVLKVQCGTGATVTIDGTGDTITDESSGYYRATTNDTISPTNEDPCLYWTEGAGIYAGVVAKMPFPFKAVAIVDGQYSGVVVSSADCTNSQTVFDTDLTQSQTDHWKDSFITFTSGTLEGQSKPVTAFNGATKCITIRSPGFSATPTAADKFILINK